MYDETPVFGMHSPNIDSAMQGGQCESGSLTAQMGNVQTTATSGQPPALLQHAALRLLYLYTSPRPAVVDRVCRLGKRHQLNFELHIDQGAWCTMIRTLR